MNKLISISGNIESSSLTVNGKSVTIVNDKKFLSTEDVKIIRKQICDSILDWNNSADTFCDPIISVRYCRVIPKTKRIKGLFSPNNGKTIDSAIIGAYFDNETGKSKHVMVYRLSSNALEKGIQKLDLLIKTLEEAFNGIINEDQVKIIYGKSIEEQKDIKNTYINKIQSCGISVSLFGTLVQDVSSVEKIFINKEKKVISEPCFVSLYDTGLPLDSVLSKLNLPTSTLKIGSDTDGYSLYLVPSQYSSLVSKYPYLVSMALVNVATIPTIDRGKIVDNNYNIPVPRNEPIVGVIDTDFDTNVPFADWVDFHKISDTKSDTNHGTSVTSLIVDGPALNPTLEDGCGRFRVRHFSVIGSTEMIYQEQLFDNIDTIVRSNRDIKVWNLSLGTDNEIERNTISPVGALLDRLQAELDVVFIVAGTNNRVNDSTYPLIGAPADSINSIVVNSVDEHGDIPPYARKGPVLDFFVGPSLCSIGGSVEKPLIVYTGHGRTTSFGTSYATCWVTRKMAYLMHKLNLTREVSKALLIDAAYGWNNTLPPEILNLMGAGILPQHISDIIYTPNDEYKVIIRDTCTKYMTYGYNIPIPLYKDKFPFFAKATLCYFPWCSRRHGVDYPLTELDLHFGQMNGKGITSINNNKQGDDKKINLYEEDALKEFRKWDCVKHISEGIKPRSKGKSVLLKKNDAKSNQGKPFSGWGFSLLKKQRFDNEVMDGYSIPNSMPFGLILTFKSIDNRNRADDFMRFARLESWHVHTIDVDAITEVIEEGEVDIVFSD